MALGDGGGPSQPFTEERSPRHGEPRGSRDHDKARSGVWRRDGHRAQVRRQRADATGTGLDHRRATSEDNVNLRSVIRAVAAAIVATVLPAAGVDDRG